MPVWQAARMQKKVQRKRARRPEERFLRLRIRALIDQRKWTLDDLDRASGIDKSRLSRLSRGEERFNQDHVEDLIEALKVDVCELFHAPDPATRAAEALRIFEGFPQSLQDEILVQMRALAAHRAHQKAHEED